MCILAIACDDVIMSRRRMHIHHSLHQDGTFLTSHARSRSQSQKLSAPQLRLHLVHFQDGFWYCRMWSMPIEIFVLLGYCPDSRCELDSERPICASLPCRSLLLLLTRLSLLARIDSPSTRLDKTRVYIYHDEITDARQEQRDHSIQHTISLHESAEIPDFPPSLSFTEHEPVQSGACIRGEENGGTWEVNCHGHKFLGSSRRSSSFRLPTSLLYTHDDTET